MLTVEQAKKWVVALRSGNYKQGKYVLYSNYSDVYCCLGVLACDVLKKDKSSIHGYQSLRYIGLEILSKQDEADFMAMNDISNMSFNQIADYIEEKYLTTTNTVV